MIRKIATVATRVVWGPAIDDWPSASTRGRVLIILRGSVGYAAYMLVFTSLYYYAAHRSPFVRPFDIAKILQRAAENLAVQFVLGLGITWLLAITLAREVRRRRSADAGDARRTERPGR